MRNSKQVQHSLKPETVQKINELAKLVHGKKSNIVEWAVNELYDKVKKNIT